jgi:hypothetical protein
MWWKKKQPKHDETAEDAKEDLALDDKDADQVAGGGGQPHMGGTESELKY